MRLRAVVVLAGCGAPATPPVENAGTLPHEARAAPATCVGAGRYTVTVDLTHARITQANATDTAWCTSMLMAVPAAELGTMQIGYEDGALAVRWPPSRKVRATATGACAFAIADPPIPVTIEFTGSAAEGLATYSLGTANRPDASCTATNAKLVLERAGD